MENFVQSQKIESLFTAARNARDAMDAETAKRNYEEIIILKPDSWEALFYLTILKANEFRNGEISNVAISIRNCLPKVFELIKALSDENNRKSAVKEVADQCFITAQHLWDVNTNFYNSLIQIYNPTIPGIYEIASSADGKRKIRYESAERGANIGFILGVCGDMVELYFGMQDVFYSSCAVACWERMVSMHFEHIALQKTATLMPDFLQKYANKIKFYNPNFLLPNIQPTEKRNYNATVIIITVVALAVGILYALSLARL